MADGDYGSRTVKFKASSQPWTVDQIRTELSISGASFNPVWLALRKDVEQILRSQTPPVFTKTEAGTGTVWPAILEKVRLLPYFAHITKELNDPLPATIDPDNDDDYKAAVRARETKIRAIDEMVTAFGKKLKSKEKAKILKARAPIEDAITNSADADPDAAVKALDQLYLGQKVPKRARKRELELSVNLEPNQEELDRAKKRVRTVCNPPRLVLGWLVEPDTNLGVLVAGNPPTALADFRYNTADVAKFTGLLKQPTLASLKSLFNDLLQVGEEPRSVWGFTEDRTVEYNLPENEPVATATTVGGGTNVVPAGMHLRTNADVLTWLSLSLAITKKQIKARAKATHREPAPAALPATRTETSEVDTSSTVETEKFSDLSREDLIRLLLKTQQPVPVTDRDQRTILNNPAEADTEPPAEPASQVEADTEPIAKPAEPAKPQETLIESPTIPTFQQHQLEKKTGRRLLERSNSNLTTATRAASEVSSITPSQSISQSGCTELLETASVVSRSRKNRTKATNIPPTYTEYFNLVCIDLHVYCITKNPFPDTGEVRDVWEQIFASRGLASAPFLKSVQVQIEQFLSSFRGHVADAARKIIESEYVLPFSIPARAERVKYLLEKNRFLSKKDFWDPSPPLFSSPVIPQVLIRYFCNTSNGHWVKNPTLYREVNGITISWVATVLWGALKRLETGTVDSSCTLKSLNGQHQYMIYLEFWRTRRELYQTNIISMLLVPIKQKLDAFGVFKDKHHVVSIPEDTQESLDMEDALVLQIEKNIKSVKGADNLREARTDPEGATEDPQEADASSPLSFHSELDTLN
ncbi:uncharacterized protein DFL_005336 [Arthrobotrys flagrans]|uniref:DUF6532 domain-containing protein n=1 Tax=Arthrobotrys flagrans TaxID=97331 RepID=A0A437A7C5_ARTFL|nr:hypothetical protein DFL_005336 [Arthrobotrys flagrans]